MDDDITNISTPTVAAATVNRSLVKPTWIVLIVGWCIILIPVPGTAIIGGIIAITAGTIMSVVNLVRGAVTVGIVQLICATVGSGIFLAIGYAIYFSV